MTGNDEGSGSGRSIALLFVAAALACGCRPPARQPAPAQEADTAAAQPEESGQAGDAAGEMTVEEFRKAFDCGECFGKGYLTERYAVPAGETPYGTTSTLAYLEGEAIALPPPTTAGGLPIMDALSGRKSSREFAEDPLPLELLSDLLWAATGVNRKEEGKLTVPTAMNRQNLSVYVATARGLFRYNPAAHSLVPVVAGDVRAATGKQAFAAVVPVDLIYVSDESAMPGDPGSCDAMMYGGAHAGMVAQNVYLFAASAGLATVVRGAFDREALEAAIGLPETQRAVLTQSVGYPAAK